MDDDVRAFEEAIICLGLGQAKFAASSDTAKSIEKLLIPEGYARCIWAERRPFGDKAFGLTDKGINAYKILEKANGRPFHH